MKREQKREIVKKAEMVLSKSGMGVHHVTSHVRTQPMVVVQEVHQVQQKGPRTKTEL